MLSGFWKFILDAKFRSVTLIVHSAIYFPGKFPTSGWEQSNSQTVPRLTQLQVLEEKLRAGWMS